MRNDTLVRTSLSKGSLATSLVLYILKQHYATAAPLQDQQESAVCSAIRFQTTERSDPDPAAIRPPGSLCPKRETHWRVQVTGELPSPSPGGRFFVEEQHKSCDRRPGDPQRPAGVVPSRGGLPETVEGAR